MSLRRAVEFAYVYVQHGKCGKKKYQSTTIEDIFTSHSLDHDTEIFCWSFANKVPTTVTVCSEI